MKKPILLILFVVVSALNKGDSARILAGIPIASYSHQIFFQMLWRELAIRGHEIVVLTADPTHENLTNFKEVDISSAGPFMKNGTRDVIALNDNKLASFSRFVKMFFDMSEHILGLPQVQGIIKDKSEHFDLVMLEFLYPSFHAFKYRFDCPFIGVTSMEGANTVHEMMGNPTHAVLYTNTLLSNPAGMVFKDRLFSFLVNQLIYVEQGIAIANIGHLNRNYFGEGYPDVWELLESVDMLFINDNPMFSDIRPLTPSTISVAGGMHMKPPKPLPKDLQTFMDASEQGVVYFSMGTNVNCKDFSNQTLDVIIETFAQIPYNVLWKFEADYLPGKPDNVEIIKWAPQQDVLRHKNVKLFITQAGMQSLEEALFSHVPLIAMPFLGDQYGNADRIAHKELGLKLNHKTLQVKEFLEAIIEVITNPKYKENITKLALLIQDQPMTPLEKAVWWTEYVLRHGGAQHLKGPRIPTYQYYHLDVLAFLGACFTAAMFLIYFMCKFAYSYAVHLLQGVTVKVKKD